MQRTFLKTISITITEPVEELYRNGIMYGTLLDFDNIIVATKAWNMLFAVMDWATAKTKAEIPKPPQTGFKENINQIIEHSKDQRLLAAWSSYVLGKGEAGFEEDQAFVACADYLEAWKTKNYDKMSKHLSNMVTSSRGNAMPKFVNEEYTRSTPGEV